MLTQRPITIRHTADSYSYRIAEVPSRHRRVSRLPQAILNPDDTRTPWYEQKRHLFIDVHSKEDLQTLVKASDTHVAVEFYAGWCASCKSAYPALCKVASDPKHRKFFTFAKANIENIEIKELLKEQGIAGIPYMVVYNPKGQKVIAFPASFKKMELVRKNLAAVADNVGKPMVLNLDGLAVVSQAAVGEVCSR